MALSHDSFFNFLASLPKGKSNTAELKGSFQSHFIDPDELTTQFKSSQLDPNLKKEWVLQEFSQTTLPNILFDRRLPFLQLS